MVQLSNTTGHILWLQIHKPDFNWIALSRVCLRIRLAPCLHVFLHGSLSLTLHPQSDFSCLVSVPEEQKRHSDEHIAHLFPNLHAQM